MDILRLDCHGYPPIVPIYLIFKKYNLINTIAKYCKLIGSLHEISIAFRHTSLESVFHADSHGIFYFFFKSTEMCAFLI